MFRNFCRTVVIYFSVFFQKSKPKSCLLIAEFEKYGGTKTFFISLLKYLSSKDYQITVLVAPQQIDEDLKNLQTILQFNIEKLDFDIWRTHFEKPYFNSKNLQYLFYQISELSFFLKVIKKYKISTLVCSTANPEWLLFLIICPCKFVYFLHTTTLDRLDNFKKWVLRLFLNQNKNIIVVSDSAKRDLVENWFNSKESHNIKVIHNYYHSNNLRVVSNHQISTVLTIGALEQYKNPLFWINVCEEVSKKYTEPIEFIWAGDGNLFRECKKIASNNDQIKFIGNSDEIDELYQKATVYFQPSIIESHGISVLGAMANSIPCIVSNKGGLVESVLNYETGYVVEIDEIYKSVDAIISLLFDKTKREKMGLMGYDQYRLKFTLDIWRNKMDTIFN